MKGILGRKAGMTSIFTSEGINIPVTVIEVIPNVVTNVLTKEKNNYDATQLSAFDRRDKTVSKPVLGHLKKAKTNGKYFTKEIRDMKGFVIGSKVDASIFEIGSFVDVSGQSKGKGFQGNIKRHNQKIGPKSHGGAGGSKPSRQTGSLGDVVSNRVFKGQTMPGHMGAVTRTMQNLKIISIDLTNNIIMLKGSIPGPNRGFVVVKEAIKGLPMPEPIEILDLNTSSTISRTDDESTSTIEKAKIATKLSPEVKKTDTQPEIQEKVIKEVQKNSEPKIIKNEKGDK